MPLPGRPGWWSRRPGRPDDGFARPADVVRGYAAAAERLGAVVRTGRGSPGSTPRRAGDGTTADGERWSAPTVVCTAGVWSGEVGAMAGVDLPIRPLRREIAFTGPLPPTAAPPARAEGVPFTIDYSTTAYFHGRGRRAADGLVGPGPAGGVRPVGQHRLARGPAGGAAAWWRRRWPDVQLGRGWAGLYEVTPDYNALVGRDDGAGVPVPVRGGLLGPRLPAGPGGGRVPARPVPRRATPGGHLGLRRHPLRRGQPPNGAGHRLSRRLVAAVALVGVPTLYLLLPVAVVWLAIALVLHLRRR